MIAPFNFPAVVPFWFLPYAIATGNTYVVKASEQVGIPAPAVYLPFGGRKGSQFADIRAQGKTIINFFTESRIITERFWPEDV